MASTTMAPSEAIRFRRSVTIPTARSSSPVNGSSSSTRRGSCSSARSSARRCRIPRENPTRRRRPGRTDRRTGARRRRGRRRRHRTAGQKTPGSGAPTARDRGGARAREADPAAKRRPVAAGPALAVAHLPAARRHERGHHPDQRRLAGAVGSEQSDDLAAARRKTDARDGAPSAEVAGDVDQRDLVEIDAHAARPERSAGSGPV